MWRRFGSRLSRRFDGFKRCDTDFPVAKFHPLILAGEDSAAGLGLIEWADGEPAYGAHTGEWSFGSDWSGVASDAEGERGADLAAHAQQLETFLTRRRERPLEPGAAAVACCRVGLRCGHSSGGGKYSGAVDGGEEGGDPQQPRRGHEQSGAGIVAGERKAASVRMQFGDWILRQPRR